MWIATVLLPEEYRNCVYKMSRRQNEPIFQEIMEQLKNLKDEIERLKNYYKKIFVKDFAHIERINLNKT